jgi:hypothetical protein
MAGFCDSFASLRTPNFTPCGHKLPKVSGRISKYSRFCETDTGDRVRSPLHEQAFSATRQILRLGRRRGYDAVRQLREHWSYRGDSNFDPTAWMIVHRGLWPQLRLGRIKANLATLKP